MEEIRKKFPALSKYTYLNTASCGLLSEDLVAWRRQHDVNLMKEGSVFRDKHRPHIAEIRKLTARFFGTTENTLALLPNFSFGLNVVLDGMPKNQKVLLLKGDYPSIHWPIESRDFDLCYAEVDGNMEDNIERAVSEHRPDIFAFGMVQYVNGILMDFNFLKRLKAYHPNLLLIADGTQYLGTRQFNFSESPIDVVGGSSYKWMLSGYGNAFFMINEEAQRRISPRTIGYNSADASFSNRDEIAYIGRLEPGHLDTLNYGSLGESIKFINEIGMDRIEQHLKELCQKAKNKFSEMGLLEPAVVQRDDHSTIFNLRADERLFQKLADNNIISSYRRKGVRVSFHFYNNDADLDRLVEVLSDL
jgi:selenocysteine lyase/cysteine desulfurase